ncbi:MAG TPA: DUF885 domain-containing protein [Candidatus Binataceae bacterium]|nr:DUF885 domain-containing protein [Candidatus Binataceae bacterium]
MRYLSPSRRPIIAIVVSALLSASLLVASAARSDDDAFHKLTHDFIEADLRTYPEMATDEGDHRYDDRVTDLSRTSIEGRIAATKKWQREFESVPRDGLPAADEADREWLIAQLDGRLLDDETLRSYERSPGAYLPVGALHSLIKRNFAPLEVRMRAATARETAALHNLALARVNLKAARTAQVTVDIMLSEMPSVIAFLKDDLPQAFASIPTGASKKAFLDANAKLVAATRAYAKWLKDDFRPHATGNYAIGADAYQRMLADDEMVDIPLGDLVSAGEDELTRLQAEFVKTAHQIDPNHSPAEVAAALNRDHPTAEQLIPTITAGLADLRAYVVAHHLATIPSEIPPLVRETPPAMRATTFASMDTPGPFEKSTEAYFYVTLPDPSWPPSRKEQLLEFFSAPLISDTSTHEVYPGHYVQFLNNRLNPDKVRAIYASGANAEGWALYCEQMMLDEGLHNGDPKYRLAQLQMALMRACRYLVGIRMHTRVMTVEQAKTSFENNAYMTEHNAEVEAFRGTEDPGYLRYQLGKLMILKLRADVRKKEGAQFDLGKFHDAFLREGALPIRLIRRDMLGNDGPLL